MKQQAIYYEIKGIKPNSIALVFPIHTFPAENGFLMANTIKQLMLLYCDAEDRVWLQVRMQHRLSPGLNVWWPRVRSGSMSSSVVLLSSKSVFPQVRRVSLESRLKDSGDAVRVRAAVSHFIRRRGREAASR